MSKKQDQFSEVSNNEIWREVIRREDAVLKNKQVSYSCNLKALKKDQVTSKPTSSVEAKSELSPEEDELATKILNDYGIKTNKVDPAAIRVPLTSSAQFGLFNHYAFPDERRKTYVKKGCEETRYAQNFYTMTGKSAYSKSL